MAALVALLRWGGIIGAPPNKPSARPSSEGYSVFIMKAHKVGCRNRGTLNRLIDISGARDYVAFEAILNTGECFIWRKGTLGACRRDDIQGANLLCRVRDHQALLLESVNGRGGVEAMTRLTITAVVLALVTVPTLAGPLPYPKQGVCAPGYRESGGYCAPMRRDAPQAIPKLPGKQCPSGWASSAHSCVEIRGK